MYRAAERVDRSPRNVVAVRALPGLGDFLCAVPAWRAVRRAWPEARIALVGLPSVRPLVERFGHYLDELIEFPGYPGIAERAVDRERLRGFLREMQGRRYDVALQMHGSGTASNRLTVLLGARTSAGCFVPGEFCPDAARYRRFCEEESEVLRLLRVLRPLGIEPCGEQLEFPLRDDDWMRGARLRRSVGLDRVDYVCLHPGASLPERRWPPAVFATVGRRLAERGLRVVLTGTADERAWLRGVEAEVPGCVNLAGRTSLGTLAELLGQARLLVCNDTGVSHLAAALRTASVVLFTVGNRRRWSPLDARRHRAIEGARGVRGASWSLEESVRRVLNEVDDLLAGAACERAS